MANESDVLFFTDKCNKIFEQVSRDIVGEQEVVENAVIAMICGGNVLLEGVPGTGKTRLVRSLGRVFDMPFSRIQFTPDLMPADVTGTRIIEKDENGRNHTVFQPGPIFSHIVLADEINRATPKTQSALLEAMQEHTVTAGGETFRLEEPFFVLATQNPIEQDGTYVLPEAQTDRFMFKLTMTFPKAEELRSIVSMTQANADETAEAVLGGEDLLRMREVAREILVLDEVLDYAVRLVEATHPELDGASEYAKKYVRFGASPRAAQALISGAKARALTRGRFNVSFEDIDALACPVLRHRIKPSFAAVTEKISPDDIVLRLLAEIGGKKPADVPDEDRTDKKKKKSRQDV